LSVRIGALVNNNNVNPRQPSKARGVRLFLLLCKEEATGITRALGDRPVVSRVFGRLAMFWRPPITLAPSLWN